MRQRWLKQPYKKHKPKQDEQSISPSINGQGKKPSSRIGKLSWHPVIAYLIIVVMSITFIYCALWWKKGKIISLSKFVDIIIEYVVAPFESSEDSKRRRDKAKEQEDEIEQERRRLASEKEALEQQKRTQQEKEQQQQQERRKEKEEEERRRAEAERLHKIEQLRRPAEEAKRERERKEADNRRQASSPAAAKTPSEPLGKITEEEPKYKNGNIVVIFSNELLVDKFISPIQSKLENIFMQKGYKLLRYSDGKSPEAKIYLPPNIERSIQIDEDRSTIEYPFGYSISLNIMVNNNIIPLTLNNKLKYRHKDQAIAAAQKEMAMSISYEIITNINTKR